MLYTREEIYNLGLNYDYGIIASSVLSNKTENIEEFLISEISKCDKENLNKTGILNIVKKTQYYLLKDIAKRFDQNFIYSNMYDSECEYIDIKNLIDIKTIKYSELRNEIKLFNHSNTTSYVDECCSDYEDKYVRYLQDDKGNGSKFLQDLNIRKVYITKDEKNNTNVNALSKEDLINTTREDYSYETKRNSEYTLSIEDDENLDLKYILTKYVKGNYSSEEGEIILDEKYTLYVLI